MSENKIIYFAYGANLDIHGMDYRCPGHNALCRGVLHNHALVFKGVADICPSRGDLVHGALYEISEDHLRSLDRFEGYPHLYIRKTVSVTTEDGVTIDAIAYQMTDQHRWQSRPDLGYLNTILSGIQSWGYPIEICRDVIIASKCKPVEMETL
jgi:gamma-glutamylcyclotransferase (GGCT)/AIG2-like uncharacterized protein YtfP